MQNSFGARDQLQVAGRSFEIFRVDALQRHGLDITRLPCSLKILLRREDGVTVTREDIEALVAWSPARSSRATATSRDASTPMSVPTT